MSKRKKQEKNGSGSAETKEINVLPEIQPLDPNSKPLTKTRHRRKKKPTQKNEPDAGSVLTADKENKPTAGGKPTSNSRLAVQNKPTVKSSVTSLARTSVKSPDMPPVDPPSETTDRTADKTTFEPAAIPPIKPTSTPGCNTTTKPEPKRKARSRAKSKRKNLDIVVQWNRYWGKGDLSDWQRLCTDLGVHGELKTKEACKEAMKPIWVNIHDFLAARDKQCVQHWPSERALADYTKTTKKWYPRDQIEKDSPLRLLMARIEYDTWQRTEGRRLGRGKEKRPGKYAFVPPPVSYGGRKPVRFEDEG